MELIPSFPAEANLQFRCQAHLVIKYLVPKQYPFSR